MAEPCNECIKGTIHKGVPKGKEEAIHGLNTYVVGNRESPRGIIVIYSDIFGIPLPNNRLIADAYAASGEWLVYLPDFFKGDPVPLKLADVLVPVDSSKQSALSKYGGLLANAPSFVLWSTRHKDGPTDQICTEFLRQLRLATPKDCKIGMVGFCWGGRYAIRAAQESRMIEKDGDKVPLVDAVVALHPSHVATPVDVEKLVVPVTFGWGKEDSFVKLETKTKVEQVHAKEARAGRKLPDIEHKVYTPGRHGFGVRGNPDDPQERACLEGTEKQALDWMNKWL